MRGLRHPRFVRSDLIHRPGVGTSASEAGVLTPESPSISLLPQDPIPLVDRPAPGRALAGAAPLVPKALLLWSARMAAPLPVHKHGVSPTRVGSSPSSTCAGRVGDRPTWFGTSDRTSIGHGRSGDGITKPTAPSLNARAGLETCRFASNWPRVAIQDRPTHAHRPASSKDSRGLRGNGVPGFPYPRQQMKLD
jgi:hypothetical protein